MSGRPSREVGLALAHIKRTACTPQAAATKYGLAVSTVRRALARAGVPANAVGRPRSSRFPIAHSIDASLRDVAR